jgi:hypothetical protein
MKSQTISENQMIEYYLYNLKNENKQEIIAFREVKNNQKRIDIVQFPVRKRGLGIAHAIEFKVFNWRAGFKQALGNRVLMPYNSIAIWEDYEYKINKEELLNEGIGLVIVSKDKNKVKIKPSKSQYLMRAIYQNIRKNIQINLRN